MPKEGSPLIFACKGVKRPPDKPGGEVGGGTLRLKNAAGLYADQGWGGINQSEGRFCGLISRGWESKKTGKTFQKSCLNPYKSGAEKVADPPGGGRELRRHRGFPGKNNEGGAEEADSCARGRGKPGARNGVH